MPILSSRCIALVAACAAALAWGMPHPARADEAGRKKTEGCLISYDGSSALVVKNKNGGKEETYKVKQATSVLDKNGTVATKNGRKATLADLEKNRPIIVYWVPQGSDKFANKVDGLDAINKETGKVDADVMEDAGCKAE